MSYEILEYLNYAYIRGESPSRFVERGEAYYECGDVKNFKISDTKITAKVRGTHLYTTKIWVNEKHDTLDYSCSCPVGDESQFCKHLVATALTAINPNKKVGTSTEEVKPTSLEEIKRYFNSKKKSELLVILADIVKSDYKLRDKFALEASLKPGKSVNISYYKKKIDSIFSSYYDYEEYYYRDYDSDDETEELTQELYDAIDAMQHAGSAAEVKELCEYFFTEHNRLGYSGDDAYTTTESLLEEHIIACKTLKTDPIELANTLFELEIQDVSGALSHLEETYDKRLGKTGIAQFKKRAAEAWKTKSNNDTLRYMMERHAQTLEDWIAIRAVCIDGESDYCVIAERCLSEKNYDLAFEWMLKGQKAGKGKTSPHLIKLLIDEYKRRKNYKEMMTLAWDLFEKQETFSNFTLLKKYAEVAGEWGSQWRPKALEVIAAKAGRESKRKYAYSASASDLLINIMVHEKNNNKAWDYYDQYGCLNQTLLHLADAASTKTHIQRAIDAYQATIRAVLSKADKNNYETAVKRLIKLKKIMPLKPFKDFCLEIRDANKRRPNMITLMNRNKL